MSADRLSGLDASFLYLETGPAHMHVASTTLFEGPTPEYEEMLRHIESRLHLVPRFRQKLRMVPYGQGRPKWVDDPQFNLRYHIRHTALPAPGSEEQLRTLAARIFSQRLDRSKPLWEMWLVDKVEGNRFAIVTKSHHCLIDGVSGVDITNVLFDTKREPESVPQPEPWVPQPEPSDAQLLAEALLERLTSPAEAVRGVRALFRAPRRVARKGVDAAEAAGAFAKAGFGAPDSPFNVEIGPYRRFATVQADLAELKRIKNAVGGTLNDVVLAAVTGALGRYLRGRGFSTHGLEAAGDGPDQRPRRRRARRPRQPRLLLHGAAAGLVRRPRGAHAAGSRDDGRPEAVEAGSRRDAAHRADRLRPADHRQPGGATAIAPARLQPRGHQRSRSAVSSLPARAGAARALPDGSAGQAPGCVLRDHELQRSGQLRADRRLRRDADLEVLASDLEASLAELSELAPPEKKSRKRAATKPAPARATRA